MAAVGTAACVAAEADATSYMHEHSGGSISLTAEERAELQRRMAEVEGSCSLAEATRFGRDVLEPWAAIGSEGRCGSSGGSTPVTCPAP